MRLKRRRAADDGFKPTYPDKGCQSKLFIYLVEQEVIRALSILYITMYRVYTARGVYCTVNLTDNNSAKLYVCAVHV